MRHITLFLALIVVLVTPAAHAQGLRGKGRGTGIGTVDVSLPGAPTNFSPPCGATGVVTNPTLSFTSSGASSYTIKLDTFSPPTTVVASSSSYAASGLPLNTVHYWIATGINGGGSTSSSPCAFTTTNDFAVSDEDGSGGDACTNSADDSPTGRNPTVLWNCAWQRQWNLAKIDYDANPSSPATWAGRRYKYLKDCADSPISGGLDIDGVPCLPIFYQISGNATYATKAYDRMGLQFFCAGVESCEDAWEGNFAREHLIEYAVVYEWIKHGLTTTQKNNYIAEMNAFVEEANPASTDRGDSDQMLGEYFGVVIWKMVSDGNATALSYYNLSQIGGLIKTTVDFVAPPTTMRNAVYAYANNLAKDGEWVESTEYNTGTVWLLALGYEAVRTHEGIEYFPEVKAFLERFAIRQIVFVTPDYLSTYLWGDNEGSPRNWAKYHYQRMSTLLVGIIARQNHANAPLLFDMVRDAQDLFGESGNISDSGVITSRGLWLIDPYQTRGDRTTLTKVQHFTGQGITIGKDGWAATDTLAAVNMRPNWWMTDGSDSFINYVDHQHIAFGDLYLWRDSGLALHHPIGYNTEPIFLAQANNMFGFWGGLYSSMREGREVIGHVEGSNYFWVRGTTGGSDTNRYGGNLGPTVVHEGSRGVLWLPSTDKNSDTFVVHDRFNLARPQDLATYTLHWNASQRAQIEANTRWEATFHSNVSPTCSTNCTWAAANGDTVVVEPLLPTTTNQIYDETTLGWGIEAAEKKWHVRFRPTVDAQRSRALYCVTAHDGITRSCTLVQSTDGTVDGALVKRASHNNVLSLWNGAASRNLDTPGQNGSNQAIYSSNNRTALANITLRYTPFTVPYTADTATTDLYVGDLDSSLSWTMAVDGGSATSLSVTQGLAVTTVSGTGAHSLVFTPSGHSATLAQNSIARGASANWEQGSGTTFSQSFTVAGSDPLLFAAIVEDAGSSKVTSCAYAGAAMEDLGTVLENGGGGFYRYLRLFRKVGPASGANNLVCSASASTYWGVTATQYTGTDQTTQPAATTFQLGTSDQTLSRTYTRTKYNQWVYSVFRQPHSVTPNLYAGGYIVNNGTPGMSVLDSDGPILTNAPYTLSVIGANVGFGVITVGINPLP